MRQEWAYGGDAVERLTGLKILAEEVPATRDPSSGDDECVPKGKSEAVLQFPRLFNQRIIHCDRTPAK